MKNSEKNMNAEKNAFVSIVMKTYFKIPKKIMILWLPKSFC